MVTLSSLGENSDQSDPEDNGHTPLARSTSSSGTNICRRTTPKAQKELRRGVVTEGDISSSSTSADVDEYITMNPTQRQRILLSARNRAQTELPRPLQSLTADSSLRNRSESTASTQSAYYLKVLPDTPSTPSQRTPSPPPPQNTPSTPDRPTAPQSSSGREPVVPSHFEEYIAMTNPHKQSGDSPSRSPLSSKKSLVSVQPLYGESCPRNRSQGSVFAREMLSHLDTVDRVKPAKYSVQGTGRKISPAQSDAGPMYIEWHEYVDIDPAEFARQKAALSPPKVPPRPDIFLGIAPVKERVRVTHSSASLFCSRPCT